jgi:hypothetical protein
MPEFLPDLPVDLILAALGQVPGNELKTGKFDSPDSSSALVANGFGWFLNRADMMPMLPSGLGRAKSVTLVAEMRYPWAGGKHPWLDVEIVTDRYLIGVVSTRFEPFRPAKKNEFSENYDRKVWGEKMEGYTRLRRTHANGARRFAHLDDAQLVKSAYGLRSEVHRAEGKNRGLKPVLMYLYAEPEAFSNGRAVGQDKLEAHQADIAMFAQAVEGDEVGFVPMAWADMLALWGRGKMPVAEHARRVEERFGPL